LRSNETNYAPGIVRTGAVSGGGLSVGIGCFQRTIPNRLVSAGLLTPPLREFIAQYVRTIEQVEILCLLTSSPAKTWTVPEVFRTVQSSQTSIADCLESFRKSGLLDSEPDGRYRLASSRPELTQLVSELAAAYRERRVAVVETIYGRPPDTIQDFADAFKLRKGKK
jgi:hypothetical protein